MPTENRRVAAYLPKVIDERLEAFKVERGLKGDSPALVAILEEYFGLSQEVAHLSSSEHDDLSRRVDDLKTEISQLESKLFSELKGSLLGELRSELLDDGRIDLTASEPDLPSPGQLSFLELTPESESDTPSELKSESSEQVINDNNPEDRELIDESPEINTNDVDQPLDQISLHPSLEVDQELDADDSPSELNDGSPSENSKSSEPLDRLIGELHPLSEAELAERWQLQKSRSIRNKRSNSRHNPQEFIDWSIEKDPEDVAWVYHKDTRLYHPIPPDSDDF